MHTLSTTDLGNPTLGARIKVMPSSLCLFSYSCLNLTNQHECNCTVMLCTCTYVHVHVHVYCVLLHKYVYHTLGLLSARVYYKETMCLNVLIYQ